MFAAQPNDEFSGSSKAPIIYSESDNEITLDVKASKVIKCKGSESVTWWSEVIFSTIKIEIKILKALVSLPKQRVRENIGRSVTVSHYEDSADDEFPFKSNLMFSELSTHDVGFYYCVLKNVHDKVDPNEKEHYDEEVEKEQATSIYVYVNGKEKLFK